MDEGRTILVVEDEGVVARQLQLTLSDLGYHVPSTAASAEEAFRLAEELRPNLILMDIHIEGDIDGIEAAALLRARFDVPVLYLTAYADRVTVKRAKLTEPYGYLVKPVDATKLQSSIEIALYKHQVDHQLRVAEAKFEGIVSISADAIITIDDAQRITLFNSGAERIFGYSRAEVLGAPLAVLMPERFRDVHRSDVDSFSVGPAAARIMGRRVGEILGRRKTGEEFPAAATISRAEIGDLRLLTVTLRDISEQKRIEKVQRLLADLGDVLSRSLDLWESLASMAQLIVRDVADWCIVDLVEEDGQVRRLSVAAASLASRHESELVGRVPPSRETPHVARQVLGTEQPVLMREVTTALLESLAQGEEHLVARAANITSALAVPVTSRGQRLGALVLASSSPARAYGPTELRLAKEIARRAALTIENARLYSAAQRAIEARDIVLGVVAHDLRNPLHAIALHAALLRRRGGEPERRSLKPAEAIERCVTRLNRLIQDLLDVTCIEAGGLSIEQTRLSPGKVVSDFLEAQMGLAASRSIDLQRDVAPDIPDVWGDCDRLLQVLENLIGNAFKFTGPGGRIVVGAAPSDGEVLFWVADTGTGIPTDDMPHVFDRFWQARRGGRRGAGLGLPIVRGIVEGHGGRVWVERTPGGGSTFFFTIPAARATAAMGG